MGGSEQGRGLPYCGRLCPREADRQPLILQERRSEVEYAESRCHCRSSHRDFFPLAQPAKESQHLPQISEPVGKVPKVPTRFDAIHQYPRQDSNLRPANYKVRYRLVEDAAEVA